VARLTLSGKNGIVRNRQLSRIRLEAVAIFFCHPCAVPAGREAGRQGSRVK